MLDESTEESDAEITDPTTAEEIEVEEEEMSENGLS